MDSKLACGHVNKLLLEVAIDLGLNLIVKIRFSIMDLFYLEDSYVKSFSGFYLEIVGFIDFPVSSYHGFLYFPLLA